eukprot:jgi/Psemu1/58288/gm1.58288_g
MLTRHLVVLKHRNNRLLHFSAQAISTSSRLHRVAQQQGSTLLSEYIHPPVNDDQEEQQAETPTLTEAMNGPNAAGFLKAMEVGMHTLLSLMETFDDVVATNHPNQKPSTHPPTHQHMSPCHLHRGAAGIVFQGVTRVTTGLIYLSAFRQSFGTTKTTATTAAVATTTAAVATTPRNSHEPMLSTSTSTPRSLAMSPATVLTLAAAVKVNPFSRSTTKHGHGHGHGHPERNNASASTDSTSTSTRTTTTTTTTTARRTRTGTGTTRNPSWRPWGRRTTAPTR